MPAQKSAQNDTTTLVCLFHNDDHAKAALDDLRKAGVPQTSISVMGGKDSGSSTTLESLGVPARDLEHLRQGLQDGGSIVAVSAISQHVDAVERIFGEHSATKIDEVAAKSNTSNTKAPAAAVPMAAAAAATRDETAIPVIEEELQVGKRTVDQGGVRVFRRTIETPVEESVRLREEHVVVERNPVNRPATQAELDPKQVQSLELTETAEEAVVQKSAQVVEEVVVGKVVGEHVEHIRDTVRRTEVEVEELPAAASTNNPKSSL